MSNVIPMGETADITAAPEALDGAPEWARLLYWETKATHESLDAILLKFEEVAGEVKPLIDQLSSHPMARMFLGGKSK